MVSRRQAGFATWAIALSLSVLVALAGPGSAHIRMGSTHQVDLDGAGKPSERLCSDNPTDSCEDMTNAGELSSNGRWVTFASNAPGLADDDTNGGMDVFVKDMWTDEITRASVSSTEEQAEKPLAEGLPGPPRSTLPAISGNGRYVAFHSSASNLVGGDTNLRDDIFVRDLKKGETERISVDSRGTQGDILNENTALATNPQLSLDGRYIVWESSGIKLTDHLEEEADNVINDQIYLHDRKTGTTTLISRSSDEQVGSGDSNQPRFSPNGRYVAFSSDASNLIDEDNNGQVDVFVRDLQEGTTQRVSVASDGTEGTAIFDVQGVSVGGRGHSAAMGVSNDGDVAFWSEFYNLVPADSVEIQNPAAGADVFLHTLKTGRTTRVSVTPTGETAGARSRAGTHRSGGGNVDALSGDGRYLLIESYAALTDDERDPYMDVYVVDLKAGSVDLVNVTDNEKHIDTEPLPTQVAVSASLYSAGGISGNGRYLSVATHVPLDGPTDGKSHIYLRDRGATVSVGNLLGTSPSSDPRTAESGVAYEDEIDPEGDISPPLTGIGADLVESSIAFRPEGNDLFLRLAVSDMPRLDSLAFVTNPLVTYGIRIETTTGTFVVRTAGGVGVDGGIDLEVTRCDGKLACTPLRTITGYYGTTGFEVVGAVPIEALDLSPGATITGLTAFTTLRGAPAGMAVVDELEFDQPSHW